MVKISVFVPRSDPVPRTAPTLNRHPSGWQGDYPRNDHSEADSLLGSDASCHTAYASTANPSYGPRRAETYDWNQPQGVVAGDSEPIRVITWKESFNTKIPATLEKHKTAFWLTALTFFLLGLVVKDGTSSFFPDPTDPAVRERIRSNWEKEYQHHQVQVDKMQDATVKWAEEIRAHDASRLAMQSERAGWEAERKKWEKKKRRELEKEKEKEDKGKAGIKWAGPQPDPHCLRYGTRKWTAKLDNVPAGYDPIFVCRETKALIHGRWVLPDNCENKGAWAGTIGTWYIDFDEAACNTFWTPPRDKGCTAEGSGKRRIEAQLENLRPGDDWMAMCSSTPAEFHGLKFDGPHSCNDWGVWGYWGLWFIEDGDCY
ncbi:hypothetical protein BKA70DRAFT_1225311 [Coprinopsis sp. MPI-PUGE-AT-0042]|nr:hypothetical protein BKA70DRAFT_1225311 [Coprinopsis sp. MPI-PUGE-AT-0042]